MTLTEASILTRKSLKIGALVLVIGITIRIMFILGQKAVTIISPPPPPSADYRFDNLDDLKLPAFNANLKLAPDATFSYKLQTVYTTKDSLPNDIQNVARIYFKPVPTKVSFTAEEQITAQASRLGFTDKPKRPANANDTKFTWQDPQQPLRTLEIDALTRNFLMQYDFGRDPAIITEKGRLPKDEDAKNIAKKYLKDTDLYQDDFETGSFVPSYWKITAGALTHVSNIAEADITRVDVFRGSVPNIQSNYPAFKNTKEIPIFTPDPKQGLVYFLFTGSNDPKKYLTRLSYIYWNIDKPNFGIYPLISVQQAFEELKKGKGYIASFYPKKPTRDVTIIEVKLGYYESEEQKKFLYPIYVFRGDDEFMAYVPASINQKPPPPAKKK